MGKLRHIALSVKNTSASSEFFQKAFDMEVVGKSGTGTIYLSDGTISVALLNRNGKPLGYEGQDPFFGIDHFGIWVDDIETACQQVEDAGATHIMGNKSGDPNSFYEIKYRMPTGETFDITTSGWHGAVKNVQPTND